MLETELKIALDPKQEARLRRHAGLTSLRVGNRKTQNLVSVYYDTPDHDLAKAGIALRLRKVGRRWIQTIKFGKNGGGNGFFSRSEIEMPAPGGRLVLEGPDPEGMFAEINRITAGGAVSPVFETRIRRVTDHLKLENGSEIELALDHGEVVAGDITQPIHEAEIELLSGEVAAVYDVAQMLFESGPVRFGSESKAARGYRLARGETEPPVSARNAGSLNFDADATVESVARDVLRDCFAQIAANMVVVADTDLMEGPHQLRVGLRRIRTAFSVFGDALGKEAFTNLSEQARILGQIVGSLRDIDVLIDEVVADTGQGLDDKASEALIGVLEKRRTKVRADVRDYLVKPECVNFLFDLGRMIEGRGWLAPSDYSQTARLAAPVGEYAPVLLDKRYKKVSKYGKKIRKLEVEALHEMRKELKKLRYTADVFETIYPGKKVKSYIKSLKTLQDKFGSLNDAAMVEEYFSGTNAPGRSDAAAQRAVGWILGTLAVQVGQDRPKLFDSWDEFAKEKPFWS
ncbi:CHAD domain-containing protein [Amaricoccus macauensis]|uniref:CYTH and CHAD domain-containing protein n=1 Tax=Amaricoccus macauensis TaxID=57001 RepID=UPI003C7C38D7